MAESKTKIAQELTPAELEEFCAALKDVPHGEMAAKIQELAAARNISIGKTAAYEFKNKEALPWLRRLQLRKQKAEDLNKFAAENDQSGRTLADHAAAELGQMAFDFVTDLDGNLDLNTKEGLAVFDTMTKGIKRLRDADRAMIDQLQDQVKQLQEEKKHTSAAVLAAAAEKGASPVLIESVRAALNFRPPQSTPPDQAAAA